jgi:hypothetical protein
MIYGSKNQPRVPEDVGRQFPRTEQFGYEMITLRLRAVCDTMQDRDSLYTQAKDAHLHVATVGPRKTKDKRWYGIYW